MCIPLPHASKCIPLPHAVNVYSSGPCRHCVFLCPVQAMCIPLPHAGIVYSSAPCRQCVFLCPVQAMCILLPFAGNVYSFDSCDLCLFLVAPLSQMEYLVLLFIRWIYEEEQLGGGTSRGGVRWSVARILYTVSSWRKRLLKNILKLVKYRCEMKRSWTPLWGRRCDLKCARRSLLLAK